MTDSSKATLNGALIGLVCGLTIILAQWAFDSVRGGETNTAVLETQMKQLTTAVASMSVKIDAVTNSHWSKQDHTTYAQQQAEIDRSQNDLIRAQGQNQAEIRAELRALQRRTP